MTKDTFLFDPKTNHFTKLASPPEMTNRMFHAVAYAEETDLLYMHGGQEGTKFLNDIWMMDINGKK